MNFNTPLTFDSMELRRLLVNFPPQVSFHTEVVVSVSDLLIDQMTQTRHEHRVVTVLMSKSNHTHKQRVGGLMTTTFGLKTAILALAEQTQQK